MAIPQPDGSPKAHQSMSWPKIDILCADHAMLIRPYPSRSCLGNKNFEKNGEGHMWEWCEIMIKWPNWSNKNHNVRKPCCFLHSEWFNLPLDHIGYDCYELPAYLKVEQINFDIQFWKQCCSVMHDWRNFNNVSFESIMVILYSYTPELGHSIPL